MKEEKDKKDEKEKKVDCVGSWVNVDNEYCVRQRRHKTYLITTAASNGGKECPEKNNILEHANNFSN